MESLANVNIDGEGPSREEFSEKVVKTMLDRLTYEQTVLVRANWDVGAFLAIEGPLLSSDSQIQAKAVTSGPPEAPGVSHPASHDIPLKCAYIPENIAVVQTILTEVVDVIRRIAAIVDAIRKKGSAWTSEEPKAEIEKLKTKLKTELASKLKTELARLKTDGETSATFALVQFEKENLNGFLGTPPPQLGHLTQMRNVVGAQPYLETAPGLKTLALAERLLAAFVVPSPGLPGHKKLAMNFFNCVYQKQMAERSLKLLPEEGGPDDLYTSAKFEKAIKAVNTFYDTFEKTNFIGEGDHLYRLSSYFPELRVFEVLSDIGLRSGQPEVVRQFFPRIPGLAGPTIDDGRLPDRFQRLIMGGGKTSGTNRRMSLTQRTVISPIASCLSRY